MKNKLNLASWIPRHIKWIKRVRHSFLLDRKMSTMDYLSGFVQGNEPLDELAFLIFARMFHIHIGIIHANGFWTTSVDKDLSVCDIILAFTGPKLFCDTAELEKVVVNCDIYFLSSVGDEYLILPSD